MQVNSNVWFYHRTKSITQNIRGFIHSCSQGAYGAMPPKFVEHIVVLCFKRQYRKQNSVIRLKSNILPLPKSFGLATLLVLLEDC